MARGGRVSVLEGNDPKAVAGFGNAYWHRAAGNNAEVGFAMPFCRDCSRFHFYPRPACPWCKSANVAPSPASGRGTVYSYSVVHRAPSAAFAGDVPYVVAIVETDEGPHLMSRLVEVAPGDAFIGMRVEMLFGFGADAGVPVFKPASGP